jgi:hypothetical protein
MFVQFLLYSPCVTLRALRFLDRLIRELSFCVVACGYLRVDLTETAVEVFGKGSSELSELFYRDVDWLITHSS